MIKVFTAFSGYDSQCMALDRLGIDYELVGWSEIDRYAIQAHNAVYPQWADRNYGDISKIDWASVPDFDLFTYSFPCTDISSAGQQKGLQEGSGTRSSLLWECKKAIEAKKPKYLLMENVKALTSEKFMPFLIQWEQWLAEQGYSNFTKVLNSKDYGVPQNRERVFMVSLLDEQTYHFPEPFELKLRLKDVLEQNVDERYYLSKKFIDTMERRAIEHKKKGNGFDFIKRTGEDIAAVVKTRAGSQMEDNYIIEPIACAMRGRNPDNPTDRTSGIPTIQMIEFGDNISNCITTVNKDSLVAEPKVIEPNMFASELDTEEMGEEPLNDVCVEIEWKGKKLREGDGLYLQTTEQFNRGGLDGISRTLKANMHDAGVVQNYRIRKLTERECFRLMGVSEADIDKIQASGVSKTQQYKMAGNSIVVDVLYHIFRKMLVDKDCESEQLVLF